MAASAQSFRSLAVCRGLAVCSFILLTSVTNSGGLLDVAWVGVESMDLETGCGLPSNGEKARLIIGTAG